MAPLFPAEIRADLRRRVRKNAAFVIDKVGNIRGYTDCFGHSLVLRGAADAMVDPIVSIWDVAPLACLVEEAGGEYFSLQGEATIQGKSFITCGPNLKHEILSSLKRLANQIFGRVIRLPIFNRCSAGTSFCASSNCLKTSPSATTEIDPAAVGAAFFQSALNFLLCMCYEFCSRILWG
jgi:histidinol-phosphatase